MSWQRTPPDFGRWFRRPSTGPEDAMFWWAIWDNKAEPILVRVFCRSGWMQDYAVMPHDTNWLIRPGDFAWWWDEPVQAPSSPDQ